MVQTPHPACVASGQVALGDDPASISAPTEWGRYELAVNDMVERTSTPIAPWVLVEGEDKRYARVKVLETIVEHLGNRLDSA